jgi:hypothetical protein
MLADELRTAFAKIACRLESSTIEVIDEMMAAGQPLAALVAVGDRDCPADKIFQAVAGVETEIAASLDPAVAGAVLWGAWRSACRLIMCVGELSPRLLAGFPDGSAYLRDRRVPIGPCTAAAWAKFSGAAGRGAPEPIDQLESAVWSAFGVIDDGIIRRVLDADFHDYPCMLATVFILAERYDWRVPGRLIDVFAAALERVRPPRPLVLPPVIV